MTEQNKKGLPDILIMTSVEAEKEALERGLNGFERFKVALTGVDRLKQLRVQQLSLQLIHISM